METGPPPQRALLTDAHKDFFCPVVPIQVVPSSNEQNCFPGERPYGVKKSARFVRSGRREWGDKMSRLAIALIALFVLVFTGGLNPAPQHEGLLLISLTLLMYMAAFSVTKKKRKL
jgi:hypothetical protein